jgi:hypothetical protein
MSGQIYNSPSYQDPAGSIGFNGAGNLWQQSDTGIWLSRNKANTGWNAWGSGDQAMFGLMPLTGGPVSGAISGASGLMTADGNTPFAKPPTITNYPNGTANGTLMATLEDLYNFQNALSTIVYQAVSQAIAGIVNPGIRSNIAIGVGTINPAKTYLTALQITPSGLKYPDGTAVSKADCYGFATSNIISTPGAYENFNLYNVDTWTGTVSNPPAQAVSKGIWWQSYTLIGGSVDWAAGISYIIIALRPGS